MFSASTGKYNMVKVGKGIVFDVVDEVFSAIGVYLLLNYWAQYLDFVGIIVIKTQ
jgi:hypothetical protein